MRRQVSPKDWIQGAWWELATYGSLVAVAAAMRLWDLGSRAMHHDESLHALYAWNIYSGNGYVHNPMMHGPFQMEAIAGLFFVFRDSDYTARLLAALAGTALVLLPYFFRARLGQLGALVVSALLAFSPTMLYFSRFARNDIIMAVWTLGLVICMWRYIDEGRRRYLYVSAALLALAFTTKETAYIASATLGFYLFLLVVSRHWPDIKQGLTVGEVSPPVAMLRIATGTTSAVLRRLTLSGVSRATGFFVLLVTLTLPMWSAAVSVLQDTPLLSWSNLVLASPVGGEAPIGAPSRGGLVIAFLVVAALLWISVLVGFKWNRSVWWRCAVIFYTLWVLVQTTFLTHLGGIGSGIWQALGYWVVQQGEARGAQPWFYYFMVGSIYEFLPLILGVVASVYYARRDDPFGRFLVVWAVTTFVLYSIASEKMPWLLVNVALPFMVLSGKFVADVVKEIEWRRLVSGGGLLLLAAVPVFLVLLWRVAYVSIDAGDVSDVLLLAASIVVLGALVLMGVLLARRVGYRNFAGFAIIPLAGVLLVLSVRAGWYASYRNGDTPVEMIVYTQTSPDILGLVRHVEEAGAAAGDRTATPITIDQTSGFAWPWHWYFRDYSRVGFASYDGATETQAPDSSVVLVHSGNKGVAEPAWGERFSDGIRVKHRWWFPETYRGLTLGKFIGALVDRQAWRRAMDYFLHRKLTAPLGSEDAYVYFSQDFPSDFTPLPSR